MCIAGYLFRLLLKMATWRRYGIRLDRSAFAPSGAAISGGPICAALFST